MSIRIICEKCGKPVKAPDSAAGKRGKCPFCKNSVQIPSYVPINDTVTKTTANKKEHVPGVVEKGTTIKQARLNEQKTLVTSIRGWLVMQFIAVVTLIIVTALSFILSFNMLNLHPALRFLLTLIAIFLGFLAINAWWLQRWAILCEVFFYSGISLWNLIVLISNLPQLNGEILFYASGSIFITWVFFRAYKADLSIDSELVPSIVGG
ncbi:MAG: hypothetical protein ABII09_01220 [Planctomycetota bacterium]